MRLLLVTLALFICNACAAENHALCDTEDRYETASHFSDFVQKVNFKYAFGDIEGLSTSDVIKQVANTDQDYQEILRSFDIKSHVEGDNVVMLLCDGESLIIEDAGCTAKVERILACGERIACEISLDVNGICN